MPGILRPDSSIKEEEVGEEDDKEDKAWQDRRREGRGGRAKYVRDEERWGVGGKLRHEFRGGRRTCNVYSSRAAT